MRACVSQLKTELKGELRQIGNRVDHVENKMAEYAGSFNELVDAHNAREDDVEWLKAKVADLEDRSRRNNLKIRGIPESVLPKDLEEYVHTLFKSLIPELTEQDLIIDRIHRIPKPSQLPEKIPRDVLMQLHFYHIKDRLMKTFKDDHTIPERYAHLQFYADVSQYTIQFRKRMSTLTKALRHHKIAYKWGYPSKLIINKNNSTFVITTPDQGASLLKTWNIDPDANYDDLQTTTQVARIDPEWRIIARKSPRPTTRATD